MLRASRVPRPTSHVPRRAVVEGRPVLTIGSRRLGPAARLTKSDRKSGGVTAQEGQPLHPGRLGKADLAECWAEPSHERSLRFLRLPHLDHHKPRCPASLMVAPPTGRAVSSVTYASRDALVASRSAAEGLRTRTAGDIGATVTDVGEFELALAHLHVREMA